MAKKPQAAKKAAIDPSIIATPAPTESEVESAFKHDKNIAINGDIKPESALTWFVGTNPRAKGRATFARFEAYMGAETVADYMAKGGTLGDLRWDLRSGYIAIDGVTLGGELTPKAPKFAKAPKVAKAPKAKKEKAPEQAAAETELEAAVEEEMID